MSQPSVELLAPAGCFASLQAAIDAGADAVYFGLAQLNMRARARRSFQGEDLAEIMQRCRAGGVHGYLTLNTLLYDHDLPLMERLLDQAVEQGVDAVIVADVAAIQAARARGLEVHISTQLSVSNFPAMQFYAAYSDRIVLARELTLGAIGRLHKQIQEHDLRGPAGRPMEIEAFAHGAQCIAISGRCGMSLFTSNASANRGACEQNCRQEYEVTSKDSGKKLVIDNNFIMSPTDLNTLDFLDRLVGAGVRVLKLEGRARSPEYVQAVVSTYRRALDAVLDGSFGPELVAELMPDIEQVYNRGFGSGFYLGREASWSGTGGSRATHRKVLVGPVNNFYAKPSVVLVQVTDAPLSVGEQFLIVGPTTGVVRGTVKALRVDDAEIEQATKGQLLSMVVDKKVRRSDRLFKMVPV